MTSTIVGCLVVVLLACATPAAAQGPFSQVQVGGHVGINASDGGADDVRVGIQSIARLKVLPMAINAAASWYVPDDLGDDVSVGGQQLWLSALAYPTSAPWYLGIGVTYHRVTVSAPIESLTLSVSDSEVASMTQTGISLPLGRVSLFGEMQILNVFTPDKGVGVLLFTGVNLKL